MKYWSWIKLTVGVLITVRYSITLVSVILQIAYASSTSISVQSGITAGGYISGVLLGLAIGIWLMITGAKDLGFTKRHNQSNNDHPEKDL